MLFIELLTGIMPFISIKTEIKPFILKSLVYVLNVYSELTITTFSKL